MQLSALQIHGFEGIQHMELVLDSTPVTLIAGDNNSGKTSLRDAIHFLVTGESGRVKLKKNYDELLYDGTNAKDGVVSGKIDGAEYHRKVATGKAVVDIPDYPLLFPFMTGFLHLAQQPVADIQRLLAKVMNVKPTKKTVTKMLQQAGVNDESIKAALPLLSAGFPSAHKAAKSRVSAAKAVWEHLTGEKYGTQKAATWTHTASEAAEGQDVKSLEAEVKKVEKKRDKAADEFAAMRREYGVTQPCPACGVELNYNSSTGLTVAGESTDPKEYATKQKELDELTRVVKRLCAEIDEAKAAEKDSDKITAEAKEKHEEILQWMVLEKALAPTGIPLKLTSMATKPINDRLRNSAEITGWPQVMICNDLSIEYGGRNYAMLSESEAWRVDAMLAEALSCEGGVGLFVLDRMDVLSPRNRGILLKWLDTVSIDHETIIVIATLKQAPGKLPKSFSSVWIEDGGVALGEE